jgi:ribulose-phosphate 3-epimerase
MITDPLRYAPRFAEAGADAISFHVEAVADAPAAARAIRALGVAAGVSLNPATPLEALDGLRGEVDFVLVMTVVPGFGGQKFMPEPLAKARRIAGEWRVAVGIDGGIGPETARAAGAAGAGILVAGSAVFGWPDLSIRIEAIRAAAEGGRRGGDGEPWIST